MAYQIQYEYQKVNRFHIKNYNMRSYIIAVMILMVSMIVLHFCGTFSDMYFLGRSDPSQNAAEAMIQCIKQGKGLEEAVQTFCSEISE